MVFLLCIFTASLAFSQTNSKSNNSGSGKAIVFKIPDGFMRAPMTGFKGILMLDAKAPAVIFITYPNEGESIDSLRKRVAEFIPSLFGAKAKDDEEFSWESKRIPENKGDIADGAEIRSIDAKDKQLQLAMYEREHKGVRLLYGYFAMKPDKPDKYGKNIWLDDKGEGVKGFDEFWKSFKN